MEHPSFSCWVACPSLVQAEKLAYADSSLGWRVETLIEALLLVPDWVGCCRGNRPSPVTFGKASIVFWFLPFLPIIVCFSEKHSQAQTAQGQPSTEEQKSLAEFLPLPLDLKGGPCIR